MPATLVATGYGNSNHFLELNSIDPFTISVLLCQPSFLMLSTGYTLWARHFFPLGRFMRAASHTKALDADQAASLVLFILNLQVKLDALGRLRASFTSS